MKTKMIILSLCICIILTGFPAIKAASAVYEGYQIVAENNNLVLYYNETQPSIIVEDKRNGFVWSSSVFEDYYHKENMTAQVLDQMHSLFFVNYAYSDAIHTQSSNTQNIKQALKHIDNGVSVDYYFPDIGIGFTLEIWLEKSSVNFRIPADSIKEEGKYRLVSIEMLPFFGAARNGEDGYIFYPDGSGALLHFKNIPIQNPKKYSFDVFGSEMINMGEHNLRIDLLSSSSEEQSSLSSGEQSQRFMLPVFGLKRGDNAFLGIITEGEYDASINLALSGHIVDLYRIAAEFKFRRLFTYTTFRGKKVTVVERDMVKTDRALRYEFLVGHEANYSGMANVYRNYLIDTDRIKKSPLISDNVPFALNLFMGIKEESLLFDKYIPMTTFAQARDILEQFVQNGVKHIQLNLVGWTQDGYGAWPIHTPPARALGGVRGLKRLVDYAKDKDISVYLQCNFTDAYSGNGGFSKQRDIVYERNGEALTDVSQEHFLLNPFRAFKRFAGGFITQIARYGIDGLVFERFGSILYPDFNRYYPATRKQTAEQWLKIMEETNNSLRYTAVKGGNAYVLSAVDMLFDIPIEDSGYFFTDESIPFYQLVVHGMIPYTATVGNLFHDFEKQKLKWVEYGCIPYFELTYKKSDALRYTKYNHLFTSYYNDWIDIASDVYREFNERLGRIISQVMVEHKKLQDEVYKVIYQDGSMIYINYNKQPVIVEGRTIPAMNYLVVDQRGNER